MNLRSILGFFRPGDDLVFVRSKEAVVTADNIFPRGFFNVLSISGKPAGLGFYCPVCKFHVAHHSHLRIFHCGGWEHFDPKAKLKTVRLQRPATVATRQPEWDGSVEYGDDSKADVFAGGPGFGNPR